MVGVLLIAPILTATAQELPSSWWVGTIEVTDDGIFFHGEECTQEEEGAEPVCEPLDVGLDMSLAPAGAFNPSAVDPEEEDTSSAAE
jgi:hypothetical protein